MSSILDALKRLEATGAPMDGEEKRTPAWQEGPAVTPTPSDRFWAFVFGPRARPARILMAILGIAAVGGTVWLFLGKTPPQPGPAATSPPATVSMPRPAPAAEATEKVSLKPSPPFRATPISPAPILSGPVLAAAADEAEKPAPGKRPPAPPKGAGNTAASGEAALFEPTGPEPTLSPLPADVELRLQAVSWSPVPAQRIVVINNRVLHEGEAIDGFTVSAIVHDAVMVRRAKATHRIEFRGR